MTTMQKTTEQFYNEHRLAWEELVKIERSSSPIDERVAQSLTLFDTELLPHFRKEEETILSEIEFPELAQDKERIEILQQHEEAYRIIDDFRKQINLQNNLNRFLDLMKLHIKLEDRYFDQVQRKLPARFWIHKNENSEKENESESNEKAVIVAIVVVAILIGIGILAFREPS